MTELSIIMPCQNDARTLEGALDALDASVTHSSLNVETLIVDNESEDETQQLAQGFVKKFPALHIRIFARKRLHPGFGSVVRYGMAYANGGYCALVSADGMDPVELLPDFVKQLRSGTQLVQCTRYIRDDDQKYIPKAYRLYQSIYRKAVAWLIGESISDTTYGFRAFDRIFVQALGTSSKRFNICPEMTLKVLLSGGKVEYLPGQPKPFREGGSTKFQLPYEIGGYAFVVLRAACHKWRLLRWF
jgi:glycosyltransferase involved in cell wall biosynthesis